MLLQRMSQEVCRLFFCIGYFVGEERVKQQGKKDVVGLHNSIKIANGELHDVVHKSYQSNLAKCHTVSCYTRKCNFI
jgi:hypothetical protein